MYRLCLARLNRNLTQGEVAKNHFSVSSASAVERGQIRPSLGALEKLSDRLHVSVTELLSEGEFETRYAYPAVEHRESASERHREEVESGLREAQILGQQRKSDEAISRLICLSSLYLSERESALLADLDLLHAGPLWPHRQPEPCRLQILFDPAAGAPVLYGYFLYTCNWTSMRGQRLRNDEQESYCPRAELASLLLTVLD